jgi:hypothetical protein
MRLPSFGETPGHAVHQVNLRADGEHRPAGPLNNLDEPLSGTQRVSLLADLPAALGMHDDLDAGILGAHLVHMAGQESADAPRSGPSRAGCGWRRAVFSGPWPALQAPGVPDRHLLQRNAHRIAGVAAQVLVGQKQDALAARKGPLEGCARIGRGADQPAALAAKGLDGGRGVHVGQRNQVSSARPRRSSASQQASTWEISAISAMEQPAFRSGRMTCWPSRPSTSRSRP